MARAPEIRAKQLVGASEGEVFDFLADLENHWLLADRFIEVLSLERGADGRALGGRVRMRGPLGVRRTAATRVLAAERPQQMAGVAELGGETRASVTWTLTGSDDGTQVRLEAAVERTGRLDRLLLLLGGRSWLELRFAGVLERLADIFASSSAKS